MSRDARLTQVVDLDYMTAYAAKHGMDETMKYLDYRLTEDFKASKDDFLVGVYDRVKEALDE